MPGWSRLRRKAGVQPKPGCSGAGGGATPIPRRTARNTTPCPAPCGRDAMCPPCPAARGTATGRSRDSSRRRIRPARAARSSRRASCRGGPRETRELKLRRLRGAGAGRRGALQCRSGERRRPCWVSSTPSPAGRFSARRYRAPSRPGPARRRLPPGRLPPPRRASASSLAGRRVRRLRDPWPRFHFSGSASAALG